MAARKEDFASAALSATSRASIAARSAAFWGPMSTITLMRLGQGGYDVLDVDAGPVEEELRDVLLFSWP